MSSTEHSKVDRGQLRIWLKNDTCVPDERRVFTIVRQFGLYRNYRVWLVFPPPFDDMIGDFDEVTILQLSYELR